MNKEGKSSSKNNGPDAKIKPDAGLTAADPKVDKPLPQLIDEIETAIRGYGSLSPSELYLSKIYPGAGVGYSGVPGLSGVALLNSSLNAAARVEQLESEISALRAAIKKQTTELQTATKNKKEQEQQVAKWAKDYNDLRQKQELAFLLNRITPQAHEPLLTDEMFRRKFFTPDEQPAYIMAIDIRRSTELMLKARTPTEFAKFMTVLSAALETIIKKHFGVFDKFTGDGVIAFFPEFFSGPDAGYHALTAADEARSFFVKCYQEHRSSFTTVLNEVSLATGIDYGPVHLMQVSGGLTVVGAAVVYACRLSSGPGGQILLNQTAYDKISEKYSSLCFIKETEIDAKHEGRIGCYELNPNNKQYSPIVPAWLQTEQRS